MMVLVMVGTETMLQWGWLHLQALQLNHFPHLRGLGLKPNISTHVLTFVCGSSFSLNVVQVKGSLITNSDGVLVLT